MLLDCFVVLMFDEFYCVLWLVVLLSRLGLVVVFVASFVILVGDLIAVLLLGLLGCLCLLLFVLAVLLFYLVCVGFWL